MTYYGARFDHVAQPSRPVVGVVRDKDTGAPLPGAIVRNTRPIGDAFRFVQTKTDAQGRFRLDGLSAPGDDIMVAPREGEPYLPAVASLDEPISTKTLTRDFALKRGIWITGRVIDKATGKPHAAKVDYFLFKDNPHASEAVSLGYHSQGMVGRNQTASDGTFRLVGLPGHALLGARSGDEPYRMGVGAERIKEKDLMVGTTLETISVVPEYVTVCDFHVLSEINPPEGAQTASFDLALDRGNVIKGLLVDPEGRPLSGAQPWGLADWWGLWSDPLPAAEFEVTGLAPGDVRQLAFVHRQRHLSGSMILHGNVQGPIEVKLGPWGTVTGRLVDAAGQPRPGVELGWKENPNRRVEEGPGSLPAHVKTDADGRFRVEGLAPGLLYDLDVLVIGGSAGPVFKKLSIKPGETRDLGDVMSGG
jgi:hypothetical protein